MPYKLRKAPNRNLYWVVGEDGTKHSKEPIPMERAKAQMSALYIAMRKKGELKGGMDEDPHHIDPLYETYKKLMLWINDWDAKAEAEISAFRAGNGNRDRAKKLIRDYSKWAVSSAADRRSLGGLPKARIEVFQERKWITQLATLIYRWYRDWDIDARQAIIDGNDGVAHTLMSEIEDMRHVSQHIIAGGLGNNLIDAVNDFINNNIRNTEDSLRQQYQHPLPPDVIRDAPSDDPSGTGRRRLRGGMDSDPIPKEEMEIEEDKMIRWLNTWLRRANTLLTALQNNRGDRNATLNHILEYDARVLTNDNIMNRLPPRERERAEELDTRCMEIVVLLVGRWIHSWENDARAELLARRNSSRTDANTRRLVDEFDRLMREATSVIASFQNGGADAQGVYNYIFNTANRFYNFLKGSDDTATTWPPTQTVPPEPPADDPRGTGRYRGGKKPASGVLSENELQRQRELLDITEEEMREMVQQKKMNLEETYLWWALHKEADIRKLTERGRKRVIAKREAFERGEIAPAIPYHPPANIIVQPAKQYRYVRILRPWAKVSERHGDMYDRTMARARGEGEVVPTTYEKDYTDWMNEPKVPPKSWRDTAVEWWREERNDPNPPRRVASGKYRGSGLWDIVKDAFNPSKVLNEITNPDSVSRRKIGDVGKVIRTNYPPSARKMIEKYGNWTVSGVSITRQPIQSAIHTAFNLITLGAWNKGRAEENIDKLFHLGLVLTLTSGAQTQNILVEKNEVINIGAVKPLGADAQTVNIHPPHPNVSFLTFLNKAEALRPNGEFFRYDPFANNCQDFVATLLRANGIYTPHASQFVKQNIDSLLSKLPGYTHAIARGITDLGAIVNVAQEGAGRNSAESLTRSNPFVSQLKELGFEPSSYLKEARRRARDHHYPDKLLGFATDGTHKLVIPDANGRLVAFGKVNYGDHIIYQHLEKKNSVPKGTAEKKKKTFHKSHSKIKGDWAENPFSPNNLALKILW